MAGDYPFGNANENPKWTVITSIDRWFFSPGNATRDVRNSNAFIFQGHHIISENIYDADEFASLFEGLRGAGFSESDAAWNQAWLPSNEEDALRLGSALHSGSHDPYDQF